MGTPSSVQFGPASSGLWLPLEDVCTLRQTRRGENPAHEELVGSIDGQEGLLYPPIVTIIGQKAMSDYLGFAREHFGETRDLHELPTHHVGKEPSWALVVDGHSRVRACREIARRNPKAEYLIAYTAVEATTAEDIVARQIAANIHSRPSKDQEAHALAAAYAMATKLNPNLSREAFAKKHGTTAGHLSDCLYYAELPDSIKDMENSGSGLPFTLAVLIAKQKGVLEFYYRHKKPGGETKELVETEMLRFAVWYLQRGATVNSVSSRIGQEIGGLKQSMFREELVWDSREYEQMTKKPFELALFEEVVVPRYERVARELKDALAEFSTRRDTVHKIAAERASKLKALVA